MDACLLGGCDELSVLITSLINPDPTHELSFDAFTVSEGILVLDLPAGMPIAGPLRSLAPDAYDAAFWGTSARPGADLWSIDLVDRDTLEVAFHVATYDPADVVLGELQRGRQIWIQPPATPTDPITMEASWGPGDRSDVDADGIPDEYDACPTYADPTQRGPGAACDADLDDDGDVDADDLAWFSSCEGADLRRLDDRETRADLSLEGTCEAADLNGDRVIDAADTARANEIAGG